MEPCILFRSSMASKGCLILTQILSRANNSNSEVQKIVSFHAHVSKKHTTFERFSSTNFELIQNFGSLDQRPITLFPYFLLSTHFVDKTLNKKVLNLKSLSPNTSVPKGDKGLTTMLVIILFNSLQLLRVTYRGTKQLH